MIYEVIVIGAGVEGSATGYYLTSRGTKNVLMLEQFDALHTRGSSHGGSRITRKAYDQPYYVKMMEEAFRLWSEIEQQSGKKIYHKTGILVFGDNCVKRFIDSIKMNNIPHKIMTGREANREYNQQLQLPDDYLCIFEECGGILRATIAVAAMQELFVRNGGQLLDCHKVTGLIPGPVVTIETNKGSFRAKKVIVTVGAWTNKLLETTGLTLPLKIRRTEALYWSASNPEAFSSSKFPTFIHKKLVGDIVEEFYGLPIHEYPGLLKAGYHGAPEISDPDKRDASSCDIATSQIVTEFIQKHFKGVSNKPSIVEICMYTETPDKGPFLDRHPFCHNVIIGAGFSGHGFKLAPIVGKILSEIALGHPPSYDLSPFKIDRFMKPKASL